jgi:hypothetical protein
MFESHGFTWMVEDAQEWETAIVGIETIKEKLAEISAED